MREYSKSATTTSKSGARHTFNKVCIVVSIVTYTGPKLCFNSTILSYMHDIVNFHNPAYVRIQL